MGENITIIGAGASALACAAQAIRKGYNCKIFTRFKEEAERINLNKGFTIDDGTREFIEIGAESDDIGRACKASDLILVATLVSAHSWVSEALTPYIRPDMAVCFLAGSLSSLEATYIWRRSGTAQLPIVGETSTMPQSARITSPGLVTLKLKVKMKAAAFPATNNKVFFDKVSSVFNVTEAVNALDSGLDNLNIIIHPAPMIMNLASLDRANWQLSLLTDGITSSVWRLLKEADKERSCLRKAAGLAENTIEDIYSDLGIPMVLGAGTEPMGYKDRSYERYIDEDVPYGSMLISSLGRLLQVDTPVHDSMNLLAKIIRSRNYDLEAKTMDRLGVRNMTIGEFLNYLQNGIQTCIK